MTSEAMIVISTIMRMLAGMKLRIKLTATLEQQSTKMTAKHMIEAVSNLVVTARAEHIPRLSKAMGLESKSGPKRTSLGLSAI